VIKKLVLGFCLAIALFYGDCWGMGRSNSVPKLDKSTKIAARSRSKSLPFKNTEILPKMQQGKITFEKVVTPSCLENEDKLLDNLKLRLNQISDIGMAHPKELFELVTQLTGDVGEREDIYGVIGSGIFDVDSLCNMILERLVELGCSDAMSWLSSLFCSPFIEVRERCASALKYDGHEVSPKEMYVAGQYLDQLHGCKQRPLLFGDPHSILYKVRAKILQDKLPEGNYLSWALEKALQDREALFVAP